MGTDRDEYGAGSCPCGNGLIQVDRCSPDHGWGGGSWFEAKLDCLACQTTYAIYDEYRGKMPKLVLLADIDKREKATAAWHAKRNQIEAAPEFKSAKAKIEKLVDAQPSMAAKHRMLSAAGLADRSLPGFRKYPACTVDATRVSRAAHALGFGDATLDKLNVELEAIWKETRFDPPAVQTGIGGLEK